MSNFEIHTMNDFFEIPKINECPRTVRNLYENSEGLDECLYLSPEEILLEKQKWDAIVKNHLKILFEASEKIKLPNSFKLENVNWLNTSRPLSPEDFKNKITIIDFFTYCCINCEHILPYLKEVEETFKSNPGVVMIGVHSPKFPNEKDIKNVQDALLRNNITHPVFHDKYMELWTHLDLFCWPTLLILGPDLSVLFALTGEYQVNHLTYLVNQTLEFYQSKHFVLDPDPLPLMPISTNTSDILRYPSYITSCEDYIAVADSGHNRLLLLTFEGEIKDIIGSGEMGSSDGSYSEASFNNPHGIAWLKPDKIFLADTGNHSIRQINLSTKSVSTIFTNKQWVNSLYYFDEYEYQNMKFASPWDVCIGPKLASDIKELDILYIAVAGSHQIWSLYLSTCIISGEEVQCVPFAGRGREECRNNLYRMKAGFAQPSGIMYSEWDSGTLYIADSESSSIRSISLQTGAVKTVVGGGFNPLDLFQYGDQDGRSKDAKLQHPLAVCAFDDTRLFVADTYNHKVKVVDLSTNECKTFFGGKANEFEINFTNENFQEPSGLCYLRNMNSLLVADTNNHCIKSIDLETKTTKKLNVYCPFTCVDGLRTTTENFCVKLRPFVKQEDVVEVSLNADGEIHCHFAIETEDLKLTDTTHQPWNISFKGECDWKLKCFSSNIFNRDIQPALVLKCINASEGSKSELELDIRISMCDTVLKTCLSISGSTKFLVTTSENGCKMFTFKLLL